ncbi:MAG: hypothetical protein C5B53_13725 [Candidatus Melainabacteria bacterium]|nr:MAG: hypothetical protein C5B53_13725 [Candidatus Melainabacteria bacterium]
MVSFNRLPDDEVERFYRHDLSGPQPDVLVVWVLMGEDVVGYQVDWFVDGTTIGEAAGQVAESVVGQLYEVVIYQAVPRISGSPEHYWFPYRVTDDDMSRTSLFNT